MYSDGWFVDKDGIRCIEDGESIEGWWYYKGDWYYFKDGIMSCSWTKIEDDWYNFKEDGTLVTSAKINGYKLDAEGICVF